MFKRIQRTAELRVDQLVRWSLPMKALLEALAPGSMEALAPQIEDLALARAIDPARVPAHIAIIMDGNGRWAQQRNLPRVAGHQAGVPPVRAVVETCARRGGGNARHMRYVHAGNHPERRGGTKAKPS